jgi:hypothetical protein
MQSYYGPDWVGPVCVKDIANLVSSNVKEAINSSVTASNTPNTMAGDKNGRFHETGGSWYATTSDTVEVAYWLPGVANPEVQDSVSIVPSMRRSVLSSPTWRACAFSAQRWIHSIIFQLSYSWPGRKIGRCWEATRAPIQGPKPRRGVLHGIPFHSQSKSRDGIHAANPGGLGAEPTKRNSFAMIRPFHHRLCHASIRTLL